ncbi:MAG: hypothetical protein NUV65_06695 [Candidatus Roizmanbacteria bacterium]|nr:hypothetical protein [Candidatus Roizmanbacteria bacterium]
MNTNFSNIQIDYSTPKEYFYIHRVKASLFVSSSTPLSLLVSKLFGFTDPKFSVGQSNKIYTNFHNHTYSPLEVKILLPKYGLANGKLEYKHWAYIDYIKNVIHVDGMYPEKRIQDFIDSLKSNGIEILVDHITYGYVEICCRHPFNKFDEVTKALDKLAKRFIVGKMNIKTSALDPDEEYSHLIKNLYIDGYCNIKTYKHVLEYLKANQKVNQNIPPKLEIQLIKPMSLEVAKKRGVAVLKAVISSLKTKTLSMESSYEKADYTPILGSDEISQNEKVSSHLNKQEMKVLPTIPTDIIGDTNCLKLFNEIYFEAKPSNLICERLNISQSTLRRTLWKLGNLIERRGSQNPGYLYGIDTTKVNNKYHIRSITKHSSKSSNNKGKAQGIILSTIILSNILFFHHFLPFSFKTFKSPEDLFSLRNASYSSLFDSSRPSVDTALLKTDYFPNQLANSNREEVKLHEE